MNFDERSLNDHRRSKGKLHQTASVQISNRDDLATYYSPGVAAVSRAIAAGEPLATYSRVGSTVLVVGDGSAVLGLGNVGPAAAYPVLEGKALLLQQLAGLDALPLALGTQVPAELVAAVRALAPNASAILLEDIAAPACFAIEAALQDLGIPVVHDDQHATAVVVLAGLLNALTLRGDTLSSAPILIHGAGAAGIAIARTLKAAGATQVVVLDSKGVVSTTRTDLTPEKLEVAVPTRSVEQAFLEATVLIGVSVAGAFRGRVKSGDIVFALANPEPEVHPSEASQAFLIATGRSDYPNQVNNVLAFPGVFLGLVQSGATRLTEEKKYAAARALARIEPPSVDRILPDPLDPRIVPALSAAVAVS